MNSIRSRLSLMVWSASAVALLCGASGLAGQEGTQQQPFKTGTRTVAVYATVSEDSGRLVPDLTQDDFEIKEDGKVRPLTLFASEIQPITIVLMLDKSGSMKTNYGLVRAGAEAFVRRLMAGDKARVGTFSDKVEIQPETSPPIRRAWFESSDRESRRWDRLPCGIASNEAITALSGQQGRRVVLAFTDGADNPGT